MEEWEVVPSVETSFCVNISACSLMCICSVFSEVNYHFHFIVTRMKLKCKENATLSGE